MADASIESGHRILVVDDERGVVNAIRRDLTAPPGGRYRYAVEVFTDPVAALERAGQESFEAILSDYRMPGMNGLELLRGMAVLQPDCMRIVLSGQTDFDALVRLINETHIYRLIAKPWNGHLLRKSLDQAIDFRQACRHNRHLARLLRTGDDALPSQLPEPITHILVVNDDPCVASAIARSLGQRDSLSATLSAAAGETTGNFAALRSGAFSVHLAATPELALAMTEEFSIACIIADSRMAGMSGVELLAACFARQPDCTGILMVETGDTAAVIGALDMVNIYACLTKPWMAQEMRSTVAQALARRRLLLENRILAEMCEARQLDIGEAAIGAAPGEAA